MGSRDAPNGAAEIWAFSDAPVVGGFTRSVAGLRVVEVPEVENIEITDVVRRAARREAIGCVTVAQAQLKWLRTCAPPPAGGRPPQATHRDALCGRAARGGH